MSSIDVMAGASDAQLRGADLYPRMAQWRLTGAGLTGEEMIDVFKYVEFYNATVKANKKSGLPLISDGPEVWEVVLAIHPRLICTEAEVPEWFVAPATTNTFEPIKVINVEVGKVLHQLGIKSSDFRKQQADAVAALTSKCTITGLTRRPCVIKWKEHKAADFEDIGRNVVGTVACKTKWYLLFKDGTYRERPYEGSIFLLDRLCADPEDREPTFTNAWIDERLGEDQGKALWDWMAYLLSPGNTINKRFHVWIGPKDTGKSTGVALLQTVLGEHNVSFNPAEELLKPFVRADMRGKLLNVSEEDSGYGHQFEGTVKRITGGTASSFEVKYGSSGSDLPTYRLLFTSNDLPNIVDPSGAFAARMIALSWEKPVEGKKAGIKAINDRFEEELPAILWKCLNLRKSIVERGDLYVPARSTARVTEIADEGNPIVLWQKDATWFDPNAELTKNEIYDDYASWCRRMNYKPQNYNAFWIRFKSLESWKSGTIKDGGRSRKRPGRPRIISGLALASHDEIAKCPSVGPEFEREEQAKA